MFPLPSCLLGLGKLALEPPKSRTTRTGARLKGVSEILKPIIVYEFTFKLKININKTVW